MAFDQSIEAIEKDVCIEDDRGNLPQIKTMLEVQLRYAYVDKDDILDLESMRDQIVFSVKAQPGTRLEVPDPATVWTGFFHSNPSRLHLGTNIVFICKVTRLLMCVTWKRRKW